VSETGSVLRRKQRPQQLREPGSDELLCGNRESQNLAAYGVGRRGDTPSGGKLALMNGTTVQEAFIPLPGGGTAVYNSTGLAYYRHADWLGSSRLATTPVAPTTVYADADYAPYGEPYDVSGTPDFNFTGQNQDTVSSQNSGLYDFLFREYNPQHGRWISPDPAGRGAAFMDSPQMWNRYAYVANMPLTQVDPAGLEEKLGGHMFKHGAEQDANPYLWGLARTEALYGRFEFALVDDSGQIQGTDKVERVICTTCNLHFVGSFSGQLFGVDAANNAQSRLQQIANHLKNCGGVYPLVAASAGNFKIGSSPGNYAQTSPTDDASNGFNGGNSTTTIDANNFANADPVTQTGVVVHEWFHTMQINNSFLFRFRVFFNRQSVENEANAAAKEALQKCGPG
jgi:RHS repeat-associated protein